MSKTDPPPPKKKKKSDPKKHLKKISSASVEYCNIFWLEVINFKH